MAINFANKASDGRRSRNRNLNTPQLGFIEQLQAEIESRPKALYELDQRVKTPIGIKSISDMYHSPTTGWNYKIWTPEYYYTFKEAELAPLTPNDFLCTGEQLLLADIRGHIAANG